MKNCIWLTVTFLLAICAPSRSVAVDRYFVTNLGTLPDGAWTVDPHDINSRGQVVGQNYRGPGPILHGFLWSPTTLNGTAGSMIQLPPPVTSGSGINDYGQVAAFTFTASGVYLWTPETANSTSGSLVNISFGPQTGTSLATGINSSGQITGFFGAPDAHHAFLWTPTTPNTGTGTFVELGYLPGRTAATSAADINALGQIVGSGRSGEAIATPHAFLWTPNMPNGSTGSMIDLGDLPGGNDWSVANGINARGQVVGEGSTVAGNRAFLWSPSSPNGTTGSIVNLGALPGEGQHSAANDINIHGQVVGYTGTSPTLRSSRAFLWTPDVPNGSIGTMIDLNSVLDPIGYRTWRLINATSINDLGQIVVVADDESQRRAFLLTPVPEPPTLAFSTIAALLLGGTGRRATTHHVVVNERKNSSLSS